jgi:acetolactate synthase-1/2/3 large subunit
LLERQGVRVVAGIPGGPILPIYDALSQSHQIVHVLARHEQGAGFIAQGMARSSGLPAVCMASSGPGATNLLTAIADAKLDSIPLIAITGQVPTSLIGTDAFQEVDICGLARSITKHAFFVRSAMELLQVIPRAFEIAASGRPGPVLIDIPKDIQNEMIDVVDWPDAGGLLPHRALNMTEFEAAAQMVAQARRPILYLGGGVVHAGAEVLAVRLAERACLPTVMTLMALGAMPTDHPLSLGMLGMHAARFTNLALQDCDLLIAVGARFDDRVTGKVAEFCPLAQILHIDIDPAELGKIKQPVLGIECDAAIALSAILPLVEPQMRTEWLAHIAALRRDFPLAAMCEDGDGIHDHFGLIRAVAEALDDEAIITTDVGQHQMWVAQAYPFRRPRQLLTSGGLGTMGFGLPAAIGAALTYPERTVVCFSGDGSILMNIQELATAAELGVNIKVIVMNNRSLGLVHQQQNLFYGQRVFASRYQFTPDFMRIAGGFGIRAVDLDAEQEPDTVLRELLQEKGPCLIHISIDINHFVLPIVPPGAANHEMIGH